jgi:hypothetical protein
MSVSTNQILLLPSCAISDSYYLYEKAKYTQYELRYPFIGEFAGLVKHKHRIYIRHHLLLINSNHALVSSMAFGNGFAGLTEATAEGHKNENQQYNRQNHLIYTNRNALHHFSFYRPAHFFFIRAAQNTPIIKTSIIQAVIVIVKVKKLVLGYPHIIFPAFSLGSHTAFAIIVVISGKIAK